MNQSGPVSRVLSRAAISLRRRLPAAWSDRPRSRQRTGPARGPTPVLQSTDHSEPACFTKLVRDTAPCLVLLLMGFTKPGQSPGLLVRSYRTVSPLPPPSISNMEHVLFRVDPETIRHRKAELDATCETDAGRLAVYSLLHFPYPHGRWVLPTTMSFGARTFLHGTDFSNWKNPSVATAQPTPVHTYCTPHQRERPSAVDPKV